MSTNFFQVETLGYEATLQIMDSGREAIFERKQRIRVLDDGVTFFLDRVWGDGVTFASYVCHGVKLADAVPTRKGYAAILSLPGPLRRGHVLEFQTRRRIVGAFTDARSYWELAMYSPTRAFDLTIEAPAGMTLRQTHFSAPSIRDASAVETLRAITIRVKDPKLYIPYRIDWSW